MGAAARGWALGSDWVLPPRGRHLERCHAIQRDCAHAQGAYCVLNERDAGRHRQCIWRAQGHHERDARHMVRLASPLQNLSKQGKTKKQCGVRGPPAESRLRAKARLCARCCLRTHFTCHVSPLCLGGNPGQGSTQRVTHRREAPALTYGCRERRGGGSREGPGDLRHRHSLGRWHLHQALSFPVDLEAGWGPP